MNVLKIMSDRHTAEFAGCYGDDRIRTPNLDALADRGTRYDAAYCLSPTCAPSRAAMMSGRYIHEIGTWCNAHPYSGEPDGWGKHFTQQGVHFTTIGKLDFHEDADVGIADCRKPSYRTSPDVTTLYRDQEIARYLFASRYLETGPAETINAFRGDLAVADEAANWLANDRPTDRPWITVVNFKHGYRTPSGGTITTPSCRPSPSMAVSPNPSTLSTRSTVASPSTAVATSFLWRPCGVRSSVTSVVSKFSTV